MHEAIVLLTGHAELTRQGMLKATATITLLRGAPNILVDTGDAWQGDEILAALAANGLKPADIEYVVITHGHLDHVGNNSLFPHATFVLDDDIAKDGEYWIHDYKRGPFLIESANGGKAVQVISTPGHTNHDLSVIVGTADGVVAVVGDLFEREGDWNDNAWEYWSKDRELQRANRNKILALADFIVPGHGGIFPVRR